MYKGETRFPCYSTSISDVYNPSQVFSGDV